MTMSAIFTWQMSALVISGLPNGLPECPFWPYTRTFADGFAVVAQSPSPSPSRRTVWAPTAPAACRYTPATIRRRPSPGVVEGWLIAARQHLHQAVEIFIALVERLHRHTLVLAMDARAVASLQRHACPDIRLESVFGGKAASTRGERAELFSLLLMTPARVVLFLFNVPRDKRSARMYGVGVFTQSGRRVQPIAATHSANFSAGV
jgi:hypothetical protein